MHKKRVAKLQEKLKSAPCDAFLIEDLTDLYYLTGCSLSAGSLLVEEESAHLLVDGRYIELCQSVSPVPVLLITDNPLEKLAGKKRVGFCSGSTTYERYLALKRKKIALKAIDNPVISLRLIKDPEEIRLMRQAAKLGSLGFDFLCTQLKEGITEWELATELEIFWKKQGAKSLAFDPIIAFGKNGSMPHYRPGKTASEKRGRRII